MKKPKELSHQQRRWNRHWNYRLDADLLARTIFDAAAGKLTAKDAVKIAAYVREERRLCVADVAPYNIFDMLKPH